jgi:hypothetical protein
MTKAQKHKNNVARIGCIACLNQGINSPATIHHVRHDGNGGNCKRDDFKTIGLCPPHHQFHGRGISIHDGLESWEEIHGTEQELLAQVNDILKGRS